jgi:hypothetical protein
MRSPPLFWQSDRKAVVKRFAMGAIWTRAPTTWHQKMMRNGVRIIQVDAPHRLSQPLGFEFNAATKGSRWRDGKKVPDAYADYRHAQLLTYF